jgi:hypothetical protein
MLVDCSGTHSVVVDTNVNYPLENKIYMLAILPFEDNVNRRSSPRLNMHFLDDPGNYVAYYFGTGLTGLPHFKIIERNTLESIFREQDSNLMGLLDQQDYEKIGKLTNADLLLVGQVNDLWWGSDAFTHESCVEGIFRIVCIETGETLVSSSFTVRDHTSDVGSLLSRAVTDVATQIRQKLR